MNELKHYEAKVYDEDTRRPCTIYHDVYLKQDVEAILPRWIKVSERLPTKNDIYLIKYVFMGAQYSEASWFVSDVFQKRGVTHWLDNIPPAPTETET